MGTPVVALSGDCHAARVSAAILKRIGLDDLIGSGSAEYVATAVELAEDRERLLAISRGLRDRMAVSALCDEQGFAGEMAATLARLWRGYCAEGEGREKGRRIFPRLP